MPLYHYWVVARIAQLVEQLTLNQLVPGSNPGAGTKFRIRRPFSDIRSWPNDARVDNSFDNNPRRVGMFIHGEHGAASSKPLQGSGQHNLTVRPACSASIWGLPFSTNAPTGELFPYDVRLRKRGANTSSAASRLHHPGERSSVPRGLLCTHQLSHRYAPSQRRQHDRPF